jgi:hypothetical protein
MLQEFLEQSNLGSIISRARWYYGAWSKIYAYRRPVVGKRDWDIRIRLKILSKGHSLPNQNLVKKADTPNDNQFKVMTMMLCSFNQSLSTYTLPGPCSRPHDSCPNFHTLFPWPYYKGPISSVIQPLSFQPTFLILKKEKGGLLSLCVSACVCPYVHAPYFLLRWLWDHLAVCVSVYPP